MRISPFAHPFCSRTGIILLAAAGASCGGGGGDIGVPEQPDPAAIIVVGGDAQHGPVGQALPLPLEVQVSDKSGHPISGKRVVFSLPEAQSGELDPLEGNTDANGRASTRATIGPAVGPWEVHAGVATSAGPLLQTTIHAVGEPGVPDTLSARGGDNQSALAGSMLQDSLSVRVVDRFGNPVPDVLVAWQPLEGGTVSAQQVRTDSAAYSDRSPVRSMPPRP